MTDPVRPDPATRDLLAEAFEAGRHAGWLASEDCTTHDFDAWCATKFPPPLPDEPPDGTVLAGVDGQVWQRRDDEPGGDENWRWWRAGWSDPFTWDHAVQRGADPGRRLVELPDWTDAKAVALLADSADTSYLSVVRSVLRALAERGNHDG